MSAKALCAAIGFAFGVVWMAMGFGPAVLAAVIAIVGAIIGWFIDGFIQGRLSAATLWEDIRGRGADLQNRRHLH